MKQVKNVEKEMQDKMVLLGRWKDCQVQGCELVATAEKKCSIDDYNVKLSLFHFLTYSKIKVKLAFEEIKEELLERQRKLKERST